MTSEFPGAPARRDDDVMTLRPTGWGRYFEGVFLAVWLTFWTVGEAVGVALEIAHTIDSDGDDRFKLLVRTPSRKQTITTDLFDHAEIVGFGEWLAARTNLPLQRS